MNSEQQNRNLNELVDNYASHLQDLIELLENEQEALKNREFDAIRECTGRKEFLLVKLEQLDLQRITMEQDTDTFTLSDVRQHFKAKISALLKKCNDLNSVNGGIVEISRQFNQRMLESLLGATTENNDLYNASGGNSGNHLKHVFTKI